MLLQVLEIVRAWWSRCLQTSGADECMCVRFFQHVCGEVDCWRMVAVLHSFLFVRTSHRQKAFRHMAADTAPQAAFFWVPGPCFVCYTGSQGACYMCGRTFCSQHLGKVRCCGRLMCEWCPRRLHVCFAVADADAGAAVALSHE